MSVEMEMRVNDDLWSQVKWAAKHLNKDTDAIVAAALTTYCYCLQEMRNNPSHRVAIINVKNPRRKRIVRPLDLK